MFTPCTNWSPTTDHPHQKKTVQIEIHHLFEGNLKINGQKNSPPVPEQKSTCEDPKKMRQGLQGGPLVGGFNYVGVVQPLRR